MVTKEFITKITDTYYIVKTVYSVLPNLQILLLWDSNKESKAQSNCWSSSDTVNRTFE